MLAVLALAAGCLAGAAAGGRLAHLGHAPLRDVWLLLGGAGCEFATDSWGSGWIGFAVLVVGYLALIGFAARNLRLVGMVLVVVGLVANLTVIALDGGMPVRGVPAGAAYGPRHHGEGSGDRLVALADVVSIAPLGETVSAGDLVLALGVATVVVGLMEPSRRLRRLRAEPQRWTT